MKKEIVGFIISLIVFVISGATLIQFDTKSPYYTSEENNTTLQVTEQPPPSADNTSLPKEEISHTETQVLSQKNDQIETQELETPEDEENEEPKPEKSEDPKTKEKEKDKEKINVILEIDTSEYTKTYTIELNEKQTVYELLKKASAEYSFSLRTTDYSFGVFIEEIADVSNNPREGRYWLYYLNGTLSSRGAATQKLEDGDEIAWRYEKTN